jgi:DNA-binding MarR family transcriptional regulator
MQQEEIAALKRLAKVIEAMRAIDEQLPIQTLGALLAIALKEGQSVSELEKALGMAQSSMSRNIAYLSDWKATKNAAGQHLPGLKLVEYRQDLENFTKKNVYLKKLGRSAIEHVVYILLGGDKPHGHST